MSNGTNLTAAEAFHRFAAQLDAALNQSDTIVTKASRQQAVDQLAAAFDQMGADIQDLRREVQRLKGQPDPSGPALLNS